MHRLFFERYEQPTRFYNTPIYLLYTDHYLQNRMNFRVAMD